MDKMKVGIFLFEGMTMLDAYGPLQILAFAEQFETFPFAKTSEPLPSDAGVMLLPNYGFADCPDLDILVIAGGGNVLNVLKDQESIDFIRKQGEQAKYVTSVCTGSLILAEAGLLDGYKATTHWAYKEILATYSDIEMTEGRVIVDRNRMTGGGVTAGIDFALRMIGEVLGPEQGMALELLFEYQQSKN